MKKNEVITFEKIFDQLTSSYDELSILSKKKPTDAINEFKLKLINKLLTEANKLLKNKYKPFDDFDTFELEILPFNSDVVLILSQYLTRMERLKADNVTWASDRQSYAWFVNGKMSDINTSQPKFFKE